MASMRMNRKPMARAIRMLLPALAVTALTACAHGAATSSKPLDVYGTTEPFASEAVYFVVTDRFVKALDRIS